MATGEKRRTGNPKGVKCVGKLEGGSRSIRSPDEVCLNEGLPARSTLSPGELRHLNDTHTLQFAETISNSQRVPGNTGKPRGHSRKNTGQVSERTLPEK